MEKVLFSAVIWQPLLLYSFRLLPKFHLGVLIMGLSLFFCLIDQGPPEGWRGPEDNFEDGPWHDDERGPYPPGDSPMRGRGKPRGGRRGRGVRRWHQPFPSRRCGKLSYSVGISNVPRMLTGIHTSHKHMHALLRCILRNLQVFRKTWRNTVFPAKTFSSSVVTW